VTWLSVHTMDRFLRDKIGEKFSAVLSSTSDKLDTWYQQRGFQLGVIANGPLLVSNLQRMDAGSGRAEKIRAAREIAPYLEHVLGRIPQLDGLFLTDRGGSTLVWVGERIELPMGMRAQIEQVDREGVSPMMFSQGRRIQIISRRIGDTDDESQLTLHAILHAGELDRILDQQSRAIAGHVSLAGPDGLYLASSTADIRETGYPHPPPAAGAPNEVREYSTSDDLRVVSSATSFGRFGWTVVVEEPYDQAFAPVLSAIRRVVGLNLAIVSLFSIVAYRVAVSMVKPIDALSRAARRISKNEKNVEIPHSNSRDEVGLLTRAFSEMTSRIDSHKRQLEDAHEEVESANDELRAKNQELQDMNEVLGQLSVTDGLTQLHNHRYFQDFLAKETKRAGRTHDPLALILVDIDHFKRWNDRLGHAAGDEILRRIAQVMTTLIRSTDLLARYGGEEFALVAPGTPLEGAVQLAEKMRATIAETRFFLDPPSEPESVTVSIGVALYEGDRKNFFKRADQALYRAKAEGRDCVVVAESGPEG
jgi:diguanylate cyclase (GGDEF)-like protein